MSAQSIRGGADLARFIRGRYPGGGHSGKVVEVGIGAAPDVALSLAPAMEVVATDREARPVGGLAVVDDDIFSPNPDLYRGASLLYSIRPPLEMQLAMGRLALDIGAEVIVRPLADEIAEIPGFSRTLVNFGEARFYLFILASSSSSSPPSSPSSPL